MVSFCARLNASGYEQDLGVHYVEENKAAPVIKDTTIRIILAMMIMNKWRAHIVDVQGAF